MNRTATTNNPAKWLLIICSAILIISFFIPWVTWDEVRVTGADMPGGKFFSISESNFKLANPFPQYDFIIPGLWLIPALAVLTMGLAFFNKKATLVASLAGILGLSMAVIYILFSAVLEDLGVQYSLQIGIYITILAAGGTILATTQGWKRKIVLLVVGPVLTWAGFYFASSYLENEKFEDTANTKADYTVNASDLIKEFQANDSAANAKYREKILTVNGTISAIERPNDSTMNIKFIDTTTGSYAIFPFLGEEFVEAKNLKEGDTVSVKGSCSGGVLSEILGTESISFKRCTINKK